MEQTGTIYDWSISPKGGGYDDAGGEEMVGKPRGRSKLRQNCIVGGRSEEQQIEQTSSSSKSGAETCAPETECSFYLFLFFQILLGSVGDPIDLFAALIKYRVQLSVDTIEREKYLKRSKISEKEIIPMIDSD